MLEEVSQNLLRDVEHIALGVLGLGLVLNGLWRLGAFGSDRAAIEATESRAMWGKVRSDLMQPLDLVMGVLILAFYYLKFVPSETDVSGVVVSDPSIQLILSHFMVTLFLLSFALSTIYWAGRRNPAEVFGLSLLSPMRWLGWVVVVAIPATIGVVGSHYLISTEWLEPTFGKMKSQEAVMSLLSAKDPLIRILLIINACLLAPFAEEVLFRGYLYGVMKRYTGPFFAMVVVGLLFAVVHLNIAALLPLWLFAILLTLAYEYSGSLWVPVGVHALFNTFNVVMMLWDRDMAL